MKSAALLFAYSLKRVRTMVITTGLLLAALQLVLIFVAGALQSTGAGPLLIGRNEVGVQHVVTTFTEELRRPG